MKNIKYILFFYCSFVFSHQAIITKETYGNVNVIISTEYSSEEINKGLIIGKYSNLLLEKYSFKENLILYLFENFETEKNRVYFERKESLNINALIIFIDTKNLDIVKCLKIVEQGILNIKKAKKKLLINLEYSNTVSDKLNEVLNTKIYRPKELELNLFSHQNIDKKQKISYYYFNSKFNFYNTETNLDCDVRFDNIKYYRLISDDYLVCFSSFDTFNLVKLKTKEVLTKTIKYINYKYYHFYDTFLINGNKVIIRIPTSSPMMFTSVTAIFFIDKNKIIQDIDLID
jgi:hypothetical protein